MTPLKRRNRAPRRPVRPGAAVDMDKKRAARRPAAAGGAMIRGVWAAAALRDKRGPRRHRGSAARSASRCGSSRRRGAHGRGGPRRRAHGPRDDFRGSRGPAGRAGTPSRRGLGEPSERAPLAEGGQGSSAGRFRPGCARALGVMGMSTAGGRWRRRKLRLRRSACRRAGRDQRAHAPREALRGGPPGAGRKTRHRPCGRAGGVPSSMSTTCCLWNGVKRRTGRAGRPRAA